MLSEAAKCAISASAITRPGWLRKQTELQIKWDGRKFSALQYYYSIASRDIEREIIPMALQENIPLMPWSPLSGGFLSGKYTRNKEKAGDSRRDNFDFPPINKEKAYDIIDLMLKNRKKSQCFSSAGRLKLDVKKTRCYKHYNRCKKSGSITG